ncbi:MAG: flagellin modification protein FlmD [Rhodobacteraceae bacterium]|nr:MAG: flagellin modification protein FlmD [Paracoccaceae bacterium]
MTGTVIFRCNVSAEVGIGQLMRCRELARDLLGLGVRSVLLGPPDALRQPGDAALFADWVAVPARGDTDEDFARVLGICKAHATRHLVMDDYRTDAAHQARLRAAGLRWAQFYDASRPCRFHADLLINASPHERRADYLPWLADPARTRTLFGPAYAVLRRDFSTVAPRAEGRPVRRIFLGFGGGNDRGAVLLSLHALAGYLEPGVEICVVSGRLNPQLPRIEAAVAGIANAELCVAPPDMAEVMRGCDLAVISGGTMSYEAAACGLPGVFIAVAPNQAHSCIGWQERIGAPYLGPVEKVSPAQLRRAVCALIRDDDTRLKMAAAGRALVDGKGARRINAALLNLEDTRP